MRATVLALATVLAAAPSSTAPASGLRQTQAALSSAKGESAANGRLSCTAFAVSLGGVATAPGAGTVDITVERWSTDADRQRLTEALKKGQNAMLDALRDLPRIGYIRSPGTIGWDLHYANQTPGEDGGRRVVIATDRRMEFRELVNRPRTVDYPFTFVELRLDNEGKGEGKLSLATQVTASRDGRVVHLENYEAQPVFLNKVDCRDR